MVYTPEEWGNVHRNNPRLFSTKAIKVPVVTRGKNPLPPHALVQIADYLHGLANAYMAVAKNPEWMRASEWPRVRQLDGSCEMTNKHLRELLDDQSRKIDPPEKEPTEREIQDDEMLVKRARERLRESIEDPDAYRSPTRVTMFPRRAG